MSRGTLTLHDLDVIVRQTDDLPALSGVAARVLELTAPEVIAVSKLSDVFEQSARLISSDAALAGRLMWMASQACGRTPETILEAAKALGIDSLRAAVLSNRVFGARVETAGQSRGDSEHTGVSEKIDRRKMWLHNLTVAMISRLLAERLDQPINVEQAYLAGLMHDVGKLLLCDSLPKSYSRVSDAASRAMVNVADCEKKALGVDHLAAGRRLARCWRLGASVEHAAWLHHQPSEAIPTLVPNAGLVRVVALANDLAIRKQSGTLVSQAASGVRKSLLHALGLNDADLAEVSRGLDELMAGNADLLALANFDLTAPTPANWLEQANAELGRMGRQLTGNEKRLLIQADAMAAVSGFAADVSAEANLPDVLVRLAEAFAAIPGGDEGSLVAYCLDDRAGMMLAVRLTTGLGDKQAALGQAVPQWRTFPLKVGWHGLGVPHPSAVPGEVLSALLGEVEGWSEWVDLSATRHVPLASQGRWLGGLICPAGCDDKAARQDAMAHALALTLGVVRQRSYAEAVSEELAGASQLLADTREALAESRAFAALGDLAAGAGHELNTPLAVVSGRAQLMRERCEDPDQRKAWQVIADQAQRISDIISDLMEFASPKAPRPEPVNVRLAINSAAKAFSSSDHPQAGSCKVDIEVEDRVGSVLADAEQLRSVLVELLSNAATAAGSDGTVMMSATTDAGRRHVLLKVSDNGPGMDGETLVRAWTPFFSAQKAGRRRGLGLSKAKRYTENNGGRIWIDSEPGSGTVLTVQLPAAQTQALEGKAEYDNPQAGPSTGG